MLFFDRLFKKNVLLQCPRCLGKGFVDWDDIKRLKRSLKWNPGSCAYCNGTGKVTKKLIENVPVDTSYLSISIPLEELEKLHNCNSEALNRAKRYEKETDMVIEEIKKFHINKKWNVKQICEHYFANASNSFSTDFHKIEFTNYVKRVVESITGNE